MKEQIIQITKELLNIVDDEHEEARGLYHPTIPAEPAVNLLKKIIRTPDHLIDEDGYIDQEILKKCIPELDLVSEKKLKETTAPNLLSIIESLLLGEYFFDTGEESIDFQGRWKWEAYHAELSKILKKPIKKVDIESSLKIIKSRYKKDQEAKLKLSDGSKIENVSPEKFLEKLNKNNPAISGRVRVMANSLANGNFQLSPTETEKIGDSFWYIKEAMEKTKNELGPIWSMDKQLEDAHKALRYWRDKFQHETR